MTHDLYLQRAFSVIDLNYYGVIAKEELRTSYIVKEGERDEEALASFLLNVGDLNGDGVLSFEEFRKLIEDSMGQ